MHKLLIYLFVIFCGASLTFSYAPFDYWWLAPIGMVGFLGVLISQSRYSVSWLTWWFAFAWFGAGISWVHVSIADFGGLPLIVSMAMMAALCGYLALYPVIAVRIALKLGDKRWFALYLPISWLLAEWLRSWMLSGFPWLSIGYSQLTSPLAGWIPVIGETGTSALLIMICTGAAMAICKRRWLTVPVIMLVPFAAGYVLNTIAWTKPTGEVISTAMIQGNIKQELRWVPEQDAPTMQAYIDETLPYLGADLIVWPEAAIPKLESLAIDYIRSIDEVAAEQGSALITGIVNYHFESEEVYNNLIAIGKRNAEDTSGHYRYMHNNRFAKHHLLPIGEFVPFESVLRELAPIFDLPMSSFNRGDFQQRNLVANGFNIAPAICFEIAFPRQVLANVYSDTDVLLTVSNDAWFGRSHGPAQHMQIAQVRAKELGLPLIRSTNNGISGFVDHRGKLVAQLPQFERTATQHDVVLVGGITPYRYMGDGAAWIIFILFAGFARLLDRPTSEQMQN
ncbi:apolipoprotein N-acyltransferase [Alteromonas sp. ASW11-36]|uniref:Apolipoprotein N-acyltransferase n=1 Tax=Alteromonas arenosi TaxID=3055817 RepID=A0ABT7T090_9ALTE|nr:apolipoprotein N-acyltransferase [Alteromonas sp. ASW11-36]MDM7861209.1 apolipoprotein N-acyltransferase [Alteromonas sp. ASW11-36]